MQQQIAIVTPSSVRRVVSVAVVFGLGAVFIYLAFSSPPESLFWQAFLIVAGIAAVVVGEKMWRATALSLILTKDALIDSSGRELCKLDQITAVDLGALAFKPTNGFMLSTNISLGRVWAPGLWWRIGRRIGVGGATPGNQSKIMAEAIALRIARRDE